MLDDLAIGRDTRLVRELQVSYFFNSFFEAFYKVLIEGLGRVGFLGSSEYEVEVFVGYILFTRLEFLNRNRLGGIFFSSSPLFLRGLLRGYSLGGLRSRGSARD